MSIDVLFSVVEVIVDSAWSPAPRRTPFRSLDAVYGETPMRNPIDAISPVRPGCRQYLASVLVVLFATVAVIFVGPVMAQQPLGGPGSNGVLSWTSEFAVFETLSEAGSTLQAVSAATFMVPEAAAILGVAGITLGAVSAGPASGQMGESFDDLWPTGSPACLNKWSNNHYPTGWKPGVKPLDLQIPLQAQFCTCTVQWDVAYKNTYYACDSWGPSGYLGYTEALVGTDPGSGMAVATWTFNE